MAPQAKEGKRLSTEEWQRNHQLISQIYNNGEQLTQEELTESVRLFYELNPECIDWDQERYGTPADIYSEE